MAVKDWHPGQLVAFWLGLFVAALVIMVIVGNIAKAIWGTMSLTTGMVGVLAFLGVICAGVVVTWKWFGARQKPPSSNT